MAGLPEEERGAATQLLARPPPEAVAPVVVYLAHPACSWSGEILRAAGGAARVLVHAEGAGAQLEDATPESVPAQLADVLDLSSPTLPASR